MQIGYKYTYVGSWRRIDDRNDQWQSHSVALACMDIDIVAKFAFAERFWAQNEICKILNWIRLNAIPTRWRPVMMMTATAMMTGRILKWFHFERHYLWFNSFEVYEIAKTTTFRFYLRNSTRHTRFCVVMNTIQWRAIVSLSRDILFSGNFDQRSTKWNLHPHAHLSCFLLFYFFGRCGPSTSAKTKSNAFFDFIFKFFFHISHLRFSSRLHPVTIYFWVLKLPKTTTAGFIDDRHSRRVHCTLVLGWRHWWPVWNRM